MKTPSNDLYQLIKSLQPQEKAYFKLYLSKKEHGRILNACLYLFDRICRMKSYSEEKIKKEIQNKFHINDFPKLKNSLSYKILTSLVEYHSSTSGSIKLNRMLSEVEILVSKNLLDKALNIIKKARKIAGSTEHFDHMQLFLEFEQSIYSALRSPKIQKQKHDITGERMALLEKQQNLLIHQKNRDDIYSFYVKNAEAYSSEDIRMIKKKLINADKLPAPMTFKAKKQLLNSKALGYYFLNDRKARYKFSKQFVDLYDTMGKEAIMEDVRTYMVGLTYLMVSQTLFSKHDEVEKTYKKGLSIFEKLPSKKRSARIDSIFFALDINYIESLLNQLQFHKVIEIGEAIYAKYFKNNLVEPYGLMYLCYYLAISNLYIENFKQSLKWLNNLLPFEDKGENRLVINSKIIRIILHYELQNNELMFSLAHSLLKKIKKAGYFENLFLNFCINSIPKIKNISDEKDAFIAFRSELQTGLKRLTNKKETTDFFNYEAWIDFKIQKRPFLDILSERSIKRKV